MRVAGRIVLNQIARDQHGVSGPIPRTRAGEGALQGWQGLHTAQSFRRTAIQVRVRELQEAKGTHDRQIVAKDAPDSE